MDALAAEAIACHDGLVYSLNLGVRKLHLETNCQVLVSLWMSRAKQKSVIAPLLQQIEDLSRSFEDFHLSFSSRHCNKVAHVIAHMVS
jgi:hypothetical protein